MKTTKKFRKKMEVYNCLVHTFKKSSTKIKSQVALIAGNIMKKYRTVRSLGNEIGKQKL